MTYEKDCWEVPPNQPKIDYSQAAPTMRGVVTFVRFKLRPATHETFLKGKKRSHFKPREV